MLRFEGELWRYTGAKERAIRERFDMSPTEYYLALMRLIDREEAWAADPIVTKKLAAARSRRSATRAARRIREAGS